MITSCSDIVDLKAIDRYLEEDLGPGDLTALILPPETIAQGTVITREDMVLCGRAWFDAVYKRLDPTLEIRWHFDEGAAVQKEQTLCSLKGFARPLMTGERTALNLLQTLSGTATLSRQYAEAVRGTPVRILDTRKTIPGLRLAQKYAVRCGGCENHRLGLYDAILIKENHIEAAGSITQALTAAMRSSAAVMIEVEVETLKELEEALIGGCQRILLDEFSLEMMREAVAMTKGKAALEVSGNVTLQEIPAIAATGVDYISIGALTKNIRAIDLSMRVALER
jgi:nicotinate-nucleotide pyrophosphorylase (carboxylating)